MKLIVWLWNPWNDYKKTRHNLGFLFLDFFAQKNNFSSFKEETKFKWEISTWIINSEKVLLLKPLTYMNLSWESILKIMSFYKISPEDISVVFDDLSMEFWKIRFRNSWSAGWHNWIKSIITNIWENKWGRFKVWIWFDSKFEVSDWVLWRFSDENLETLEKNIFPKLEVFLKEKSIMC